MDIEPTFDPFHIEKPNLLEHLELRHGMQFFWGDDGYSGELISMNASSPDL